MKSLLARHHELSETSRQLQLLEEVSANAGIPSFIEKLETLGFFPLKPSRIEIFQVNLGKMCNQTCKHCHVDAGPDRTEVMTPETMELCLDILSNHDIPIVDITGGAPELNPHFRWFVEQCTRRGKHVIDRCNLTVILSNKKYHDLPEFFAKHKVEVVSSLPFYNADRTDRQRGEGVFEKSIQAMKMLNAAGYGIENSGLKLNLVYNPTGAFMSAGQKVLEVQFRKVLGEEFGIHFNQLFAITNMPISRFLDFLITSNQYEDYMEKLVNAFNPASVSGVMCRNTLSVGWDGYLYDCDFNQMLDLKVQFKNGVDTPMHLRDFNLDFLNQREIILSQHCYGCTAGAGSSCGGEVVPQV
ncbi:MAG: arsenosugar biosynthesis radical SAM (seleno)protein ArsS, partial [Chitinophagales bacterium]